MPMGGLLYACEGELDPNLALICRKKQLAPSGAFAALPAPASMRLLQLNPMWLTPLRSQLSQLHHRCCIVASSLCLLVHGISIVQCPLVSAT